MTVARPSTRSAGLTGTMLAHGLAVTAAILVARRAHAPPPIVYAVELVAAPLPSDAPRRAAQEATPVTEAETAPILPPKKKPVKVEPVKKPPPNAKVVDKAPITKSTTTPAQNETPSTGQDVVTLKQAGMQFPYPEYLRGITNKIYARWRQPLTQSTLHAEVSFMIMRDGSVRDLTISQRSGRDDFDLDALGAVEAVGRAGGFGALPPGFTGDALPIVFYFTPTRQRP